MCPTYPTDQTWLLKRLLDCDAAVLLYNHGGADGARQQFLEFQRLFGSLSDDAKAADAELLEMQQALSQVLGTSGLNS